MTFSAGLTARTLARGVNTRFVVKALGRILRVRGVSGRASVQRTKRRVLPFLAFWQALS
jgi:sorbitol-specific phosphotransferase system component IIBC